MKTDDTQPFLVACFCLSAALDLDQRALEVACFDLISARDVCPLRGARARACARDLTASRPKARRLLMTSG